MKLTAMERAMITYGLGIVYGFIREGHKMNSIVTSMIEDKGKDETLKFLFNLKEKMKEE